MRCPPSAASSRPLADAARALRHAALVLVVAGCGEDHTFDPQAAEFAPRLRAVLRAERGCVAADACDRDRDRIYVNPSGYGLHYGIYGVTNPATVGALAEACGTYVAAAPAPFRITLWVYRPTKARQLETQARPDYTFDCRRER